VLLPVEFSPCPTHLVRLPHTVLLSPDQLESLKSFQVVLWRALLKVKRAEGGDSDTCNYLVVPVKDTNLDFTLVTSGPFQRH
jgi:hypothetical protein